MLNAHIAVIALGGESPSRQIFTHDLWINGKSIHIHMSHHRI
ncbi:Uncharacterised protein [Vibrio cholerae]|nr:Uncharacterised protein [Vibrio cholerae]CSI14865.1 Uncharacterised protein [Vibrio cholerae]